MLGGYINLAAFVLVPYIQGSVKNVSSLIISEGNFLNTESESDFSSYYKLY